MCEHVPVSLCLWLKMEAMRPVGGLGEPFKDNDGLDQRVAMEMEPTGWI